MTLVEGVEREANLKAALQALILLIEHLDTYARFAEYANSEMGESLKKREHQQPFNAINKRLNELMSTQGVIPHPPASVSPRKVSGFFS